MPLPEVIRLTSFLGFILGDMVLILLSIYAIAKCGNYQAIIGRAGKTFGLSLEFIMMLCLGPIVAIPRHKQPHLN